MKRLLIGFVILVMFCAVAFGCSIGYNRMLFMTKTNVGLDIDTKPPTAELSIARREGVIAPSFEEGKALPVLASFRYEGGWLDPNISATFAGGKAAVILAQPSGSSGHQLKSKVCLSHPLKDSAIGLKSEEGDDARPFFFATDTTFGLKVAWSGTTEAVPDTLRLGYNRKEFAYAPVFGRQNRTNLPDQKLQDFVLIDRIDLKFNKASDLTKKKITEKAVILELVPQNITDQNFISELKDKAGKNLSEKLIYLTAYTDFASSDVTSSELVDEPCMPGQYELQVPSFIASIDNSQNLVNIKGSKLKYVQFFATGEAANALARQDYIRQALVTQLAPQLLQGSIQLRATNRQLIEDIVSKFKDQKLDSKQKTDIVSKAIQLGLVDKDTTESNFEPRLAQNESLVNPEKLVNLRTFVQSL
jgi:hypothetical protein